MIKDLLSESAKQFEKQFLFWDYSFNRPTTAIKQDLPGLKDFISDHISSAFALGRQSVIDEVDHEGKKLMDGFSHPTDCKMCKKQ